MSCGLARFYKLQLSDNIVSPETKLMDNRNSEENE